MKTTSPVRWLLAALAAALLLGAIGSASASAEACVKKAGSKHVALCIEGQNNQETVPLEIKQASNTGTLKLPTAWPSMEWVCNTIHVNSEQGQFGSAAVEGGKTVTMAFRPRWSECTTKYGAGVSKRCVMPREREFFEQPGQFTDSAGQLKVASGDLLEFSLESRSETEPCQSIRGRHNVGGAYECNLQQPELESAQHELTCESQGTETRMEEKPVWLKYAVKIELGGHKYGQKFSIYEY